MNEIAAQTLHFKCTGEGVWLTFLELLRRLILKDHNHVHWAQGRFLAAASQNRAALRLWLIAWAWDRI